MKKLIVVMSIIISIVSIKNISAKDSSSDWLVGYNGGYILPFGNYTGYFEPSVSFGGVFMYLTGWRGLFLESDFSYNSFKIMDAGNSTLDQYNFSIGPGYAYPLTRWLEPYVSLQGGANYMRFEFEASNKQSGSLKPFGAASAGIMISPFDYFSLRLGGGIAASELSGDMHTSYILTAAVVMRTSVFSERNILDKKEAQVAITSLELQPIFGARYTSYGITGIGYAVIKNTGNEILTDISIETSMSEIKSGPTKSKIVKKLAPGETAEIELPLMISNDIMTLSDTRDIPARFRAFYKSSKGVYSYIEVRNIIVHSKNALTWDETGHIGSFITPKNEAVITFSKGVIALFKNSYLSGYNKKIQNAMTIFDSIGAAGIVYVRDPNSAPGKASIDYVMYPGETMTKKAGDCDDLTVLYASLLESIEISTAIVTIPGHVFLMFDTGVPEHSAGDITEDSSLVYKYNGTVWIPVEVTMVGKSFIEAWKQGASAINLNSSSKDEFGVLETSLAWKKYPSSDIGISSIVKIPIEKNVRVLFSLDIDRLKAMGFDEAAMKLKVAIDKSPDDHLALNKMGTLHAKYGNIEDALQWYNKAIKAKPDYAVSYANAGNIYLQQKKFDEAVASCEKAKALDPKSHINIITLARAYYEVGKPYKAKEYYQAAVKAAPGYAKLYSYLDSDPSVRAADPEDRLGYNLWQD